MTKPFSRVNTWFTRWCLTRERQQNKTASLMKGSIDISCLEIFWKPLRGTISESDFFFEIICFISSLSVGQVRNTAQMKWPFRLSLAIRFGIPEEKDSGDEVIKKRHSRSPPSSIWARDISVSFVISSFKNTRLPISSCNDPLLVNASRSNLIEG